MDDIIATLRELPITLDDKGTGWFNSEIYFPILYKIFNLLNLRSFVVVGTRLGYNLITAISASNELDSFYWYDAERAIPNSNVLAEINIKSYLSKNNREINYEYFYNIVDLINLKKDIDILFIYNNHSVEEILLILLLSKYIKINKAIIIDDFNFVDIVSESCKIFCNLNSLNLYNIANHYRGLGIIDYTDNEGIIKSLKEINDFDISRIII
jgi:hypothetical protein